MASFFNKIFSGSKISKFYLDSWEDPVPITEVSIPGNHRLKEEVKPVDKPSFYELVSNYFYMRARDYKWGSINSIERSYGGGGVRISININPTYLFTQPLSNCGRLSIGEYRSKVSYISLSFNVEDRNEELRNLRGGYRNFDYDRWGNDRSYGSYELTISRQVYLNSSYPFVSQNNELTLSEQSVKIDIPFRCNIAVSDIRELDHKILSVIEEAKSCILHNFEKEIYKSKLEIAQKDFKSTITNELVTDNFQHVIDLVNDSSINMGDNVTLFIPVKQLQSNKEKISIDLNQKEIDIFYELMEGAARIRGEFDVQTNISFTSDGIYLKISPKFEIEIPNRTETRIEEEYFNRWENAQGGMSLAQVQPILIRNPYRDFNLE
jgi:hypothetical protein